MARGIDISGRGANVGGRAVHVGPTSAIPDGGDLQARFDFSEEDGTLPITDQTGGGNDLNEGGYTGVTTDINGVQAGEFDGNDDAVQGSWTAEGQPNHIWTVVQWDTVAGAARVYDGYSNNQMLLIDSSDEWRYFAGNSEQTGGVADTTPHIVEVLFDGANSEMRIDGSQIATYDPGTDSLDGFTIGAQNNLSNFGNIRSGETLIYPMDKSSIRSDVESYLSDKWGVTL